MADEKDYSSAEAREQMAKDFAIASLLGLDLRDYNYPAATPEEVIALQQPKPEPKPPEAKAPSPGGMSDDQVEALRGEMRVLESRMKAMRARGVDPDAAERQALNDAASQRDDLIKRIAEHARTEREKKDRIRAAKQLRKIGL